MNPSTTETAPVTETTAAAETKSVKAPAKKAGKPKAAAAKKDKKADPKKAPKAKTAAKKTEKKDRSMSGLSTVERHAKVLKAMRTLGAVKEGSAVNVGRVAAKCGLGEYEVYCALWGKGLLQTEGYVKQVKREDVRGAAFHLTAKGQKNDPD